MFFFFFLVYAYERESEREQINAKDGMYVYHRVYYDSTST